MQRIAHYTLTPLRSKWLRSIFSFFLIALLLISCNKKPALDSSIAPEFSDSLEAYLERYKAEFELQSRVASTPFDIAEIYLSEYQPIATPAIFQTTYIYDRNGLLIAELFDEGRRKWIPLDRMSQHLIDATIATEDASFYENTGIDTKRIIGAILQNSKAGEIISGASTITMQLARNLFFAPEARYDASLERKAIEVFIAQDLTELYSKDELLEIYLNLINYGHLSYGPEAASQIYFGKSAADLDIAEASFLAGIPQQPANLDPFHNFDATKRRQQIVLNLMVRHEYLSQEEANIAHAQPLTLNTDTSSSSNLAPHFIQYLTETIDEQMGIGYTKRAGLNIFSTLDMRMQEIAQEIIAEHVKRMKPFYNLTNSALVAMKPGTNEILTMVGSADVNNDDIDGQVNVAVSLRQPGSAIKPLLIATAFHDNLLSPGSVVWDTPTSYNMGLGETYRPRNIDYKYHGPVTVRTTLANSYNVPVVKILDAMGVPRLLESARAMGVESLSRDRKWYGLSLTLGGGEVTLLDMTTAYHTLANGGQAIRPNFSLVILQNQGKPFELPTANEPVQAISPEAAFQVIDILSDNEAREPTFGLDSPLQLSRPAAVKTGTTTDWRDNWTVGFTRYLVTGVWAGNSNGRPMNRSTGMTGAAPVWHEFMEAVIENPELSDMLGAPENIAEWAFVPPATVKQMADCVPNLHCPEEGEYFSQAWLDIVGQKTPLADTIVRAPVVPVHTDLWGNPWSTAHCMQEDGIERTLFRLPTKLGPPTGDTLAQESALQEESPEGQSISADFLENEPVLSPVQRTNGRAILTFYQNHELDRFRTMSWSMNTGIPVNIGPCSELSYYTIRDGDYWIRLASRYGLTTATLRGVNPQAIRENDVLINGERILVPTGTTVWISDENPIYTVQEGDSWMYIAESLGIPLRLLQVANPQVVRPGSVLQPGDELVVPSF